MDLQAKLISDHYSETEKNVITYFIEHFNEVVDMTTLEVARQTYTSNATIVRVCQKMGYKGFTDFKLKYLADSRHPAESAGEGPAFIDANFPFQADDPLETVIENVARLKRRSIEETKKLIDVKQLEEVVELLYRAKTINLFTYFSTNGHAKEFQYQCSRINKPVKLGSGPGEQGYLASRSDADSVSLFLSYTGETTETINEAKLCRYNGGKTVSITSVGTNSLARECDYNFFIPSWEIYYSKIGQFASSAAFEYVLDVFFSGLFQKEYLTNYEYMLEHTSQLSMLRINNKMI